MESQEVPDGGSPVDLPWPFTRSHMRAYSCAELGQLRVQVAAPEQTASGGSLGEGVQVMREGVQGFDEHIVAEGGGGEVQAKNDEGRFEGKGRQNVMFRHHRPFQKAPASVICENGRCSTVRAFTVYEPKLVFPENAGRVIVKSLLQKNEVPGGV